MHLSSRIVLVCCLGGLIGGGVPAGAREKIPEDKYRASTIPPGATKDAHAVVRYEAKSLQVASIREAVERVHRIVTVLDAEGRDFGELVLGYDKFVRIESLEGRLYDAGGEEIRSLEKNDVKDYPGTSAGSLYDDHRVRVASLFHSMYPYTVEFEYGLNFDGYLSWPSWYPEEEKAFVEYSQFEVVVPKERPLRYWKNIPAEPILISEGEYTRYHWEATSLSPFEREPVGPNLEDQYESVRIAPDMFEIDGYQGSFASWKSFGQWFYGLAVGRQALPEKVQQEVETLTNNAMSEKEKIRRLYAYLQARTRYISVQLGIGGWQPFEAAYVSERGYGDCKALTNYMMSLLHAVNIQAYPALIQSGNLPSNVLLDFPSNQFNHVILCVPGNPDTTWLECTSQSIPFGHISPSNEGRHALLVGKEGGTLVRTPSSRPPDNFLSRRARVRLTPPGNGSASIRMLYTGDQADYVRVALKDAAPKERETWLRSHIEIPAFNLQSVDFSYLDRRTDSAYLYVRLQLPQYASRVGERLLFEPNLLAKRTYVPQVLKRRKHPVMLSYPYIDLDSVVYEIPDGFKVEALPKGVTMETAFASYHAHITPLDAGALLYVRRFELNQTEIPPEQYNNYRKFLQGVAQSDKAIAALIKKE